MDCVSAVVFQLILETLLSTWFIRAILHQERVVFLSTLNSIYEDVFIMELNVPVQKKAIRYLLISINFHTFI